MKKLITLFALCLFVYVSAQEENSQQSQDKSLQEINTNPVDSLSKIYNVKEIKIDGTNKFSKYQLMHYMGISEKDSIELPGIQISFAVKKLWESNQFSDIQLFLSKIEGRDVYLKVYLKDVPSLNKINVKGVGKGRSKKITKEIKGDEKATVKVTENLKNKLQLHVSSEYGNKGFPDAKAIITEEVSDSSSVNWKVNIDKGPRVKIRKININGSKELSANKVVSRSFKDTRKKNIIRFWKKSKYVKSKYQEDLQRLIDMYQSYGYRDIEILKDTIVRTDKNNYDISVNINEGNRYYLGDVVFSGNSAFTTEGLLKVFGYKKGDPYDAGGINKKITGSDKDDDISTLYYDDGYVFANIVPVEKMVKSDTIDLEIRIREGEQATFNKITFEGNTRTHDHVIQRSLRTRPGDLFSKTELKRTYMELAQMGYFEPQTIKPDVQPDPQTKTVNLNWKLEEKGSSQVELQGGYGGSSFVGTLGLTFGNFSVGNMFKKKAWKPVPMGDGQSVSLRAQAGSYYQSYSISFTEPWIGGRRPTSLSVSLYDTYLNYSSGGLVDNKRSKLNIVGIQAGLTKLLSWPDNYFRFSQGINYQLYDLNNYDLNLGKDILNEGTSNNFNYYVTLGRYSSGMDPIFPQFGSDFEISLKLTPPYSLFNNKDYNTISVNERYKWQEYFKIKVKGYWHQEIVDKFVLKAGGEFGFLSSYNNKTGRPAFERFYIGGTGLTGNRYDGREVVTLRGYEDSTSDGGGNDDITPRGGGSSYAKFMLELRYPILMGAGTKIYALGFFEAGNTWEVNKDFNPFELKRSVGVGIRIFMPQFGLLGFDFAKGLDAPLNSNKASGWQPHFILGQQF